MAPRMSASAPLDELERPRAAGAARPGSDRENRETAGTRTALSFEVIPPRHGHDKDAAKIANLLSTLEEYNPDYIAVTSSRRSGWLQGTADFIARIDRETRMRPLAHLACTAGTRAELSEWINTLVDAGVRGLLALRGDLDPGTTRLPEGYLQHADDLVRLVRELEAEQAPRFAAGNLAVGVACYPTGHAESANFDEDIDVLLAKQRAGANFAITQLFFDPADYVSFIDHARLAGVKIPLIPGIMPMTSVRRVERMAQLSGTEAPADVIATLQQAAEISPEREHEVGMQLTAELARVVLAAGAGCLHIYTHNNAAVTRDLLARIGIRPRARAA